MVTTPPATATTIATATTAATVAKSCLEAAESAGLFRFRTGDSAGFGDSQPAPDGRVDTAQRAMARLGVPVLFVVAADDQPFREQARLMYRAARVADGTSMLEFGADAPRVLAAVRDFIADHT